MCTGGKLNKGGGETFFKSGRLCQIFPHVGPPPKKKFGIQLMKFKWVNYANIFLDANAAKSLCRWN